MLRWTIVYTKDGWPLRRDGQRIFNSGGVEVARLRGEKAFDTRARYVCTVLDDHLVYRGTHSASIGSVFTPSLRSPFALTRRVQSAMWGDEPPIKR